MKNIFTLVTLLVISIASFAYIPSADFIFSKVVKNAGSGIYQVKQEITFPTAQRNITVTETWWVLNDDTMFLKAEGPLFNQYYLYKKNKRYFFSPEGGLKVTSLPQDFHEDLFFERSSGDLKKTLINKKILPSQTFKRRPIIKTDKDVAALSNIHEPYLKLSRLNETISYLLGYAAKDDGAPGIWIEQDKFLIKKIKLPSTAEVTVETFTELSKNLTYPKSQRVSWDNQYVQIELSRGDSLKKGISFFDEKQFSKLEKQNKPLPQEWAQSVVGEFYKRFR